MTAQPIAFDAVLEEDGRLRVPAEAVARLAELGAGTTVHVEATPAAARPKLKSSYGVLAHRRAELEDLSIAEVRQRMSEDLRGSGDR